MPGKQFAFGMVFGLLLLALTACSLLIVGYQDGPRTNHDRKFTADYIVCPPGFIAGLNPVYRDGFVEIFSVD